MVKIEYFLTTIIHTYTRERIIRGIESKKADVVYVILYYHTHEIFMCEEY